MNFIALASIIIDDIVLPTGETRMGVLGGAGTHSVYGMRVWTEEVGFVTTVGADFPPALRRQLEEAGIDLQGMRVHASATARAWQIFEFDGHRTEIFRTPMDEFYRHRPTAQDIPPAYFRAKGFHLFRAPAGMLELVRALRAQGVETILWEPTPMAFQPQHLPGFQEALPQADIFSPNLEESALLLGEQDPERILARYLAMGARVVALRMGAEGSLVAQAGDERRWHIPAAPARVVDVTGAGNSYAGGFLVGYARTGDPRLAGLHGAVSASFTVEQFGMPPITPDITQRAQERLQALEGRVRGWHADREAG